MPPSSSELVYRAAPLAMALSRRGAGSQKALLDETLHLLNDLLAASARIVPCSLEGASGMLPAPAEFDASEVILDALSEWRTLPSAHSTELVAQLQDLIRQLSNKQSIETSTQVSVANLFASVARTASLRTAHSALQDLG